MKTLKLYTAILFSIFTINAATAQTKSESIKVWGNCEMCKAKIEKAAKAAGATKASWSDESLLLQVSYDAKKTSNPKIQQAVAKAGYDTQDYTADYTAYKRLPGCCQYDRKSVPVIALDSARKN